MGRNIYMIKVKLSSKRGQYLYAHGSYYDAFELNEIYDRYSEAKRKAYEYCYEQYLASENSSAFSIISHNTFGFSVSWVCTIDGHEGMRIETPKNSYFVDFEE